MGLSRAAWLVVNILMTPLVSMAGQSDTTPAQPEPVKSSTTPEKRDGQYSARNAVEALARKQREATRAAMEASLGRQRAAVAEALAASAGKQASPGKPPAADSFFILPPPPTSADFIPAVFPVPEAGLPEPECPPVAETEIAPILLEAAQREGLEQRLLAAVIRQESAYRPCAVSAKGAQGLMQLMPETVERFGVTDPFDMQQNIGAGARYLKQLLARYGGDVALALGAYNAGPAKVDAAGGVPAIPETTAYVKEILKTLNPPAPIPKISGK